MSGKKIELGFFGAGLQKGLVRILKNWRPPTMKTELDYRNALFERLRNALPESAKIEKEYRHGGTTVDLYVRCKEGFPASDTEVFFELKRNLTKKNEFDRLVGQIEGLGPRENVIFVILFGERDPALVGRLKKRYAEFLDEAFLGEPSMTLIEVPTNRAAPL